MTIKHVLYLGLNDKNTLKQEVTTSEAIRIAQELCGDCSVYTGIGSYTNYAGVTTHENSLRIELLFREVDEVKQIAKQLKEVLNQESIAYEPIESNSCLL